MAEKMIMACGFENFIDMTRLSQLKSDLEKKGIILNRLVREDYEKKLRRVVEEISKKAETKAGSKVETKAETKAESKAEALWAEGAGLKTPAAKGTESTVIKKPMGHLFVLVGLSDFEQEICLASMRNCGFTSDDLKAVYTAVNAHWNFYKLYENLCTEHKKIQHK